MLAQLYSRTVRVTPSGRRLDFFENKLRLAKLSLRLKARESLSTESVNDCFAIVDAAKRHAFCKAEPSLALHGLHIASAMWHRPATVSQSYFIRLPMSNCSRIQISSKTASYIFDVVLRFMYCREQVDTCESTKYVSSTIRVAVLSDSRVENDARA